MPTMFSLHEVPSVVGVGGQRPFPKIGFGAGTAIECRIGMAIGIGKVEKAVNATVEGERKMLGYGLPTVLALDIEETALVVGICLRLIEMAVRAVVFLHVAVGIQSPVALQFAHDSRRGVCQAEVVRGHTIGGYLWIAHERLHCILLDADIADERNLRYVLRHLKVVFYLQAPGQRLGKGHLGTEQQKTVIPLALPVISGAHAQAPHVGELAKTTFQLPEEIEHG